MLWWQKWLKEEDKLYGMIQPAQNLFNMMMDGLQEEVN